MEGNDVVARRSAIGLDIGTSGVRAAELSFSKGEVTLEKFGQVALPEGAVRDGEVTDSAAVAGAIRELWSHTGFSGKKVVIGVANQRVVVRQVDLPWMPLDELKSSLAFQVADMVPMPVEQALLDIQPLEEIETEKGARIIRALLVAAARDTVMGNIAAVQAGGLEPVMVDLTSFAVIRALATPDDLGMGSPVEALVDVGARVTNIVVHEGGVPRFVRILLSGGQDLTDAVAERMGVPTPQAEALKQEIGIGQHVSAELAPAARVVDAAASGFVDEIRGSLDYFMASSGHPPVTRLRLTGGGSRLAGLADRLQAATRLAVELGNPLQTLRVGRTGLSPEQLAFIEPLAVVPVGLALGVAA